MRPNHTSENSDQIGVWNKLLACNDSKTIWQKINWNGDAQSDNPIKKKKPSENEFKNHFEKLLNEPDSLSLELPPEIDECPYIPLTDDPIAPVEVLEANKIIKHDKSGGPSGIPPGILKALPNKWIVFMQ